MNVKRFSGSAVALAALSAVLAVGASGAGGAFVESDVQVLHQLEGTGGPAATFGWAVSELADIDGDQVNDAIVGEPFSAGLAGASSVFSGRTGQLLHRFDGATGDRTGFSIADAGDVDRDHVHDILVGSPPPPALGAGHVDLYSGRTGELMHRFEGAQTGDAFGFSVSSAGDVNHDHYADVLVGAAQLSGAGAGYAVVYSGRTYEPIRTLTGDATGDQFGSGASWTMDVNGDHVPDQIVGARRAGPEHRGRVYVYSGRSGNRLITIEASPNGHQFGSFFVAGVGDVNLDGTPDIYAADYADTTNGFDQFGRTAGRAGVYSGRDGSELLSWLGDGPDAGLGPGRGAGDVNRDGRPDLIVGSYTSDSGAVLAGKVQIFSGRDGSLLRTITSMTEGENLGFDAVGVGDTNRDGMPDELVSAASGNRVYVIAGTKVPRH